MSWDKMGRSKSIGGLGFRDLVVFNNALLARQGWRIMQEPNSMAAQILKAKYFPSSTFLKAPMGSKPSFAWRSLCNAKDLLLQGLVWRIEDGKSVKICGDRWLLTPTSFSVQSCPRILDASSHVAYLIDQEQRSWILTLLQEIFTEEEAKTIANIPLSPLLPKDKLIWRGTTHGQFTFRSAYHLGKEIQEDAVGQCSNEDKGLVVWKTIWALGIPNQVKIFLWRACNDVLPTRVNHFQRKVTESKCSLYCQIEEESTLHALWTCPAARDIWGCAKSRFQKCSFGGTNFRLLLEFCMERFDRNNLDLMAVVARRIWLRMNALVSEGKFDHPNGSYLEAVASLDEFRRCNLKDTMLAPPALREQGTTLSSWFPPPDGIGMLP
jgi:hypothetical protein